MASRWKFERVRPCPDHAKGDNLVMKLRTPAERGSFMPLRLSLEDLRERGHCDICKLPARARYATLVVEADRFFDARGHAMSVFHADADSLQVPCDDNGKPLTTDEPADVVLTWIGSAAGTPNTRRLVVDSKE